MAVQVRVRNGLSLLPIHIRTGTQQSSAGTLKFRTGGQNLRLDGIPVSRLSSFCEFAIQSPLLSIWHSGRGHQLFPCTSICGRSLQVLKLDLFELNFSLKYLRASPFLGVHTSFCDANSPDGNDLKLVRQFHSTLSREGFIKPLSNVREHTESLRFNFPELRLNLLIQDSLVSSQFIATHNLLLKKCRMLISSFVGKLSALVTDNRIWFPPDLIAISGRFIRRR